MEEEVQVSNLDKEEEPMRKTSILVIVLFVISLWAPGAFAQSSGLELTETTPQCGVCEGAESPFYGKSAPGKVARGLVNIGLGWTNLFAQPVQSGQSGGNVLTGICKGFGYTVM